ncbi:MAG: HEAT repeat domain-containing protein [Actinomycetota bacterium]
MSQAWPPADRPSAAEVEARKVIVTAALGGDLAPARSAVSHASDRVRVSAIKALADGGELGDATVADAAADPSPRVRRAVAMAGATDLRVSLEALLHDEDSNVVEPACWAAGERAEAGVELVPLLVGIATAHEDGLCREAAVAALGAIGHPDALPAILAATKDRATVRRRAVLALAPFEGPEVDAALARAMEDRDWQVRQAAEDLLPPG